MKNIGLYIHVPFCKSICPYCDFYKVLANGDKQNRYVGALKRELKKQSAGLACRSVDTIYFGGGTPSVLSGDHFEEILGTIRESYKVTEHAEITVECNPSTNLETLVPVLSKLGVNRVSLGLQSAVDSERRSLGRLSSGERVRDCIEICRENGISNISLDLMIGIPGQTEESLKESIAFIKDSGVPHVSAYMLKIEEGTHFYKNIDKLDLPSESLTADMYDLICEEFERIGLMQYEISNFAVPNFESRHNLKYWRCEEYLGVGPGAHSYLNSERKYFESDLDAFIRGSEPVFDDFGGSFNEQLMLALRLREGYTGELPKHIIDKAKSPILSNFIIIDESGKNIRLTREGFLVSNEIISKLI